MGVKSIKTKRGIKENQGFFLSWRHSVILLFIVSFLIYLQTISFSYSPLDDFMLIVKRLDWLLHATLKEIFSEGVFKTEGSDYYRPLLVLSFKLDAMAGQGKAWIFHLSNILYHAVSVILMFLFLVNLLDDIKTAFIFSLLFAIHPLHVHAVAWIPGRNDTLLAVFAFAAMIALQQFMKEKKTFWLLLLFLFFLCVLFLKESAILFPFVILLYYFFFHKGHKPFFHFLIAGVLIILTFGWFFAKNAVIKTQADMSLLDFGKMAKESMEALIIYFGKIFLPFNQAVIPNVVDTSIIPGSIVTLVLIFLFVYFGIKNWKLFIFGSIWFFAFLIIPLVISNFIGLGTHYEHRLYVPLLGFIICLTQLKISWKKNYLFLILSLFILTFSVKTLTRNKVYRDTFSFADYAAKESPSSAMAFNMLGSEYNNRGDYKQAIACYTKSIELEPTKYHALFNRGNAFKNLKMYDLALKDYDYGLQYDSLNAKAWFDRGNIYLDLEQYEKAIQDFNQAIKIYPRYSNAHNNRGNAYASLKNFDFAIRDYTLAIKFRATNASAYSNRGNVYSEMGEYEKALADFEKALELKPNDQYARNNVELCRRQIAGKNSSKDNNINISKYEEELLPIAYEYYKKGDFKNALSIFRELAEETKERKLTANYLSHQNNVALCLIKMGNVVESERILLAIVKDYPQNERALMNLGLLYKQMGLKEKAIEMYTKVLTIDAGNQKARHELDGLMNQ